MAVNIDIRDEKLPNNKNREVPKISSLSSCELDKYEYLTSDKNITFWSK